MSKKLRTEAVDHLFDAILSLENREECYTFFEDICTINELLSLSQRFEVAKMLREQKTYLENVISNADYNFLKDSLKKDKDYDCYFLVRFLASTGARVSEVIQFKVEHVNCGYFDLYSKGGKIRRIYIPKKLVNEAKKWLKEIDKDSGYLFVNKKGNRITTRGIALKLKSCAKKYGIDFSLKRDKSVDPPRYFVFFKARDVEVMTAAFREFTGKTLNKTKKPSVRKKLQQAITARNQDKQREREKSKEKQKEPTL